MAKFRKSKKFVVKVLIPNIRRKSFPALLICFWDGICICVGDDLGLEDSLGSDGFDRSRKALPRSFQRSEAVFAVRAERIGNHPVGKSWSWKRQSKKDDEASN